jgi:hypothetical protein
VGHEICSFAKPVPRPAWRQSVTGDVTTLEDLGVVTRLAAQHDED